jgi:hypothetical protein
MRRLVLFLGLLPALALAQSTVQVVPSDTIQSGCVLNATNAACQAPMRGKVGAAVLVTAVASPTGITLTPEVSADGTSWVATILADPATGTLITTIPNASLAVGYTRAVLVPQGMRFARVRASAWTSGSATVVVTGSDTYYDLASLTVSPGGATTMPPAVQVSGAQDAITTTTVNPIRSAAPNTAAAAVPGLLVVNSVARTSSPAFTAGNVGLPSMDVTGSQYVTLGIIGAPAQVVGSNAASATNGLATLPGIVRAGATAGTAARSTALNVDSVSGGAYVTAVATTNNVGLSAGSVAVNTATNVKASAGNVYAVACANANASVCWLQFYNTAGAPTCGTSVTWSVPIPTSGTLILPAGDYPLINHATGIAVCMGTTATGATACTTANACTIFYK